MADDQDAEHIATELLSQFLVTVPESDSNASQLFQELLDARNITNKQLIVEAVLRKYLRPLFSKSKPAAITSSGRKAEYIDPVAGRGEGIPDDSNQTKPWKYSDKRAISFAGWAVNEADSDLIAKQWSLFMPILLALVDDSTTSIRCSGLQLLTIFLEKFPDERLRSTGLSKVFEDAIFHMLSFSNLTPEVEYVNLLGPAFDTLRCLASKQFDPAARTTLPLNPEQVKHYDKIIREGIIHIYSHTDNRHQVSILDVLYKQTDSIVNEMGIHAVKHFKDLIPFTTTFLSDPFAPASPPTIFAALSALQALMSNCWPQILKWVDEILEALVLCYLNVGEDEKGRKGSWEDLMKVRGKLILAVNCLNEIVKAQGVDLREKIKPLLVKSPQLEDLFASLKV